MSRLREKQEYQREIKERFESSLKKGKKILAPIRADKKQKKKAPETLFSKIAHDHPYLAESAIRDHQQYRAKSYNLDKQIRGLIDHMYVEYTPPLFLYNSLLVAKPKNIPDHLNDMYIEWFLSIAQGKSFSKLVKAYMTSKEAHIFLKAPLDDPLHNVWWAKMRHAGIPHGIAIKLIDKIFQNKRFDRQNNSNLADIILFYSRYYEGMDKADFDEITDFIAWKLDNDADFAYKGRTLSSMINLSNEWHRLIQKAKIGIKIEWPGMDIPGWVYADKDCLWEVTELTNNRELANEGRKQKHCVYSYVGSCQRGYCHIFSMRGYHYSKEYDQDGEPVYTKHFEVTRATIEVRPTYRTIVQVRGKLNDPITAPEKVALRRWAGERGIGLSVY